MLTLCAFSPRPAAALPPDTPRMFAEITHARDHSFIAHHSKQCASKAYLSGSISVDEKALSSRKQESKALHIWWEAKGAGEIESQVTLATMEKGPRAWMPRKGGRTQGSSSWTGEVCVHQEAM